MSVRAQTGTALWASLYPGLGATGAAIKAAGPTGDHGAGPLLNDGLLDTSEYILEIAAQPAGGTVVVDELCRATLTVVADGTYTWTYLLREDGAYASLTPTTVTNTIGAGLSLAAASCAQAAASSTAAVTVTPGGQVTLQPRAAEMPGPYPQWRGEGPYLPTPAGAAASWAEAMKQFPPQPII